MTARAVRNSWITAGVILFMGLGGAVGEDAPPEDSLRAHAKDGFYISALTSHHTIGRGFDGKTFLHDRKEILLVPDIDADQGFGLVLGFRDGAEALEFSYWRSKHDATLRDEHDTPLPGADFDALFQAVTMDLRRYFFTADPVQPSVLLGITFPWVKVTDASVNAAGQVGDASFYGLGVNIGVGLSYYVHQRVSARGDITYRLIGYWTASGVEGERKSIDTISGSGFDYSLGLQFTF